MLFQFICSPTKERFADNHHLVIFMDDFKVSEKLNGNLPSISESVIIRLFLPFSFFVNKFDQEIFDHLKFDQDIVNFDQDLKSHEKIISLI